MSRLARAWPKAGTRVRHVQTMNATPVSLQAADDAAYREFIQKEAAVPTPPARLGTLLTMLQHRGMTLVDPSKRAGMHPFLVPLCEDKDGEKIGLLRWPTMPETLEMPLVKTGEVGLELLSSTTENYIRRIVSEEDFKGCPAAAELIRLSNDGLDGTPYVAGEVQKLGYGPERYQALRNAPFPDIYEWLAQQHLEKGDVISALATCEKANETFTGWGAAYGFYARVLSQAGDRVLEARDAARVSLRCPAWTITTKRNVLEEVVRIADYSGGLEEVRLLKEDQANDVQAEKVTGGKHEAQVSLDRAAHLMDSVVFGHKDWDGIRDELSERYEEGGCPEMAKFVKIF
ncbi:unnamed protein product [Chrysoparadoxa australica]